MQAAEDVPEKKPSGHAVQFCAPRRKAVAPVVCDPAGQSKHGLFVFVSVEKKPIGHAVQADEPFAPNKLVTDPLPHIRHPSELFVE